jgi:hypothetical protein
MSSRIYEYFTREQAEVLVDTVTHIVCGPRTAEPSPRSC